MDNNAELFGDNAAYEMIDRDSECDTAYGYEELHMTKEMLENLVNSKDIVVYVQMGEYVIRIIYDDKNEIKQPLEFADQDTMMPAT